MTQECQYHKLYANYVQDYKLTQTHFFHFSFFPFMTREEVKVAEALPTFTCYYVYYRVHFEK